MKGRIALTVFAALFYAGILSACSGQPNAPTAIMPSDIAVSRAHGSVSSDLLYVVTSDGVVDILSYPGYKRLGTLRSAKDAYSPITANPVNGDILIDVGGIIYDYAHGGRQPIAKINPPRSYSLTADYAFDPTTENIALSFQRPSGGGAVGIYQTPSSHPTLYSVPNMQYPAFLGYDDQGNLFVEGKESSNGPDVFAELPKGSSTFNDVTLNQTLSNMGTVQWDGSFITVASRNSLYEIQVSGSNGTIVGQTTLDGAWIKYPVFWIQGHVVLGDHVTKRNRYNGLGVWHYPEGGHSYKTINKFGKEKRDRVLSEAVSLDPH